MADKTDLLTREGIAFIIERVLDNAKDAKEECSGQDDDFNNGKLLAYYEILDTIKNQLVIRDADVKEFNLDFKLESIMA